MGKPRHSAQSLMEFALILPILLLLLTILFDLGRAIYYYSALSNAVREGARYAIVRPTTTSASEIETVVKDYAIGVDGNEITVSITAADPDNDQYYLTVAASYNFIPVTPGLRQILGGGNSILLRAHSEMEIAPIAR